MVNFETPGHIVSLQCLNPEIRMNTIMQLGIPQKCDKSVDFLGGGGGGGGGGREQIFLPLCLSRRLNQLTWRQERQDH